MCIQKDKKQYSIWVTGFCDGEGCFHVSFTKRPYRKTKVEVWPSFSIVQRARSLSLLQDFQTFFQCGNIRYSRREGMYRYEVRSVSDLVRFIIPHFQSYPLLSIKQEEYLKFEKICLLLHSNKGKNPSCLSRIVHVAFSMKEIGKRKLTKEDLLKLITS